MKNYQKQIAILFSFLLVTFIFSSTAVFALYINGGSPAYIKATSTTVGTKTTSSGTTTTTTTTTTTSSSGGVSPVAVTSTTTVLGSCTRFSSSSTSCTGTQSVFLCSGSACNFVGTQSCNIASGTSCGTSTTSCSYATTCATTGTGTRTSFTCNGAGSCVSSVQTGVSVPEGCTRSTDGTTCTVSGQNGVCRSGTCSVTPTCRNDAECGVVCSVGSTRDCTVDGRAGRQTCESVGRRVICQLGQCNAALGTSGTDIGRWGSCVETVGCRINSDCKDPAKPICDTATGTCVGSGGTCPTGKILCNNVCTTPVCTTNNDCNDNNVQTADICNNPGSCTASCSHTPVITGGAVCGNNICESGETVSSCIQDCGKNNGQTCASPSECKNGFCISGVCSSGPSDTDGGNIPNTRGTCSDNSGSNTDACLSSTTLREWLVSGSACSSTDVVCESGSCSNGACAPTVSGCGDNICSFASGETQSSCAVDCGTTVSISPSTNLQPDQLVTVTVEFNDARFGFTTQSTRDAQFSLVIDPGTANQRTWTGCLDTRVSWQNNYANRQVSCASATGTCPGTTLNGYLKVSATCRVPSAVSSGTHTLRVTPTIFSGPITLNPGTTQITVNHVTIQEWISTVVEILRSFFQI